MCEPVTLGTAAITSASAASAVALPTLIGGAGMGTMLAGTTSAATAGLFGAGGVFSWGATLNTLGTLGSGLSSLYSGRVASAHATYQGQMAEYQAQLDENNAIMAERAAEYDADIFDEKLRRVMGRQQTQFGKSNVVINQDTPLEVAVDTATEGAAERLAILYRGKTQAAAHGAGAKGQQFAAINARESRIWQLHKCVHPNCLWCV